MSVPEAAVRSLTLESNRDVVVRFKVYQRATGRLPQIEMTLSQYSDLLLRGAASFADFEQTISFRVLASKCRLITPGDIHIDFPENLVVEELPFEMTLTVYPDLDYREVADELLDLLYLGCQVSEVGSTSITLMFLVVKELKERTSTRELELLRWSSFSARARTSEGTKPYFGLMAALQP